MKDDDIVRLNVIDLSEEDERSVSECFPLAAGDSYVIHRDECRLWLDMPCSCEPFICRGPSGQA